MRWPRFRLWKVLAFIATVSFLLFLIQFKLHGIFKGLQDQRSGPGLGLENEISTMDKKHGDIYGLKKILKARRKHGDPLRFREEDIIRPEQRVQLDERLPDRIMSAMEKTVRFFAEEHASVNLDGLFGMRMCQGRIIESIDVCSGKTSRCPRDLVYGLRRLNENINNAAEMALPYAAQDDPHYYAAFRNIVEAPYKIRFIPEYLGNAKAPAGNLGNDYFGDWVNVCFASLMGCEVKGYVVPRCTISDFCWERMTREGGAEYYITHQVLYFIFGEVYGCQKELAERAGHAMNATIRERQRRFCGHIFTEAEKFQSSVKYDYIGFVQDLFAEEVLVCGIIGFLDFFKESWLKMILGWQLERGCFGKPPSLTFGVIPQNQGRKLLREKEMADGCHAHKTGLTLGLLGVFMRYYIENLYT